jgi:drug/metabolite transporter superfamily protein YnfA
LTPWRKPLSILTLAAVLAGAYFRFKGLGTAPFAVDEYYLARSIENVLRAGLPAFPCGGLYMRGLVLQYSAAALQLAGLSGELAPRLIGALCSLLALPALYLIGRREHGRMVGLLAVVILALSVWEIETARFGRMYAPFQAVFLWYLVFFLRYTVDRDRRALWPMLLLSILGPFVWEGGVFLPLTNLLARFLQRLPEPLRREDWRYLLGCTALLVVAVWFVTADFRGYTADSWPAGYSRALSASVPDIIHSRHFSLTALRHHPGWMAAAIVPAAAMLFALRWVWSRRSSPLLLIGLLVMLGAAAAHQFLVVVAVGLLLLLTRLISAQELFDRRALPLHASILLFLLFWLAYSSVSLDWHAADVGSAARGLAIIGDQMMSFPDFVGVVVRPWARAAPHLSAAILLLLAAAYIRAARNVDVSNDERALLLVFLVLTLAASASHPPREETRYVFFLYPLAIVLALGVIARAARWAFPNPDTAAYAGCVAGLLGFALSEDFQPRHLWNIDRPDELFRVGMSPGVQSHLVIREDFRSLADWLRQHRAPSEVVVNGVHGFDHYFPDINYFFVEQQDPNFPDWSCHRGTVDRWSNYPLLFSVESLTNTIAESPRAYLVAFSYRRDAILASLAALNPRVVASSGDVMIIELKG